MSGIIIVGALLVFMFLVSYWFFKLGELSGLQHFFLQLLMIGFFLFSTGILGVVVMDNTNTCNWVSTQVNSTVTVFEEECEADNSGVIFNFMMTWFYRLIIIYLFLWLLFELFNYLNWLPKKKKSSEDDYL